MGIHAWLLKLRHKDDAGATRRAEAARDSSEPLQEREVWSGDIDGAAADKRAAGSMGEASMSDVDRLSE
jgi:hypothetical protein